MSDDVSGIGRSVLRAETSRQWSRDEVSSNGRPLAWPTLPIYDV